MRNSDSQLILRESAQCAKEDEGEFQNIEKHQFFNTNNLWIRLDYLKELMDSKGGFVPLPTLLNGKTVDPQQVRHSTSFSTSSSTPLFLPCSACCSTYLLFCVVEIIICFIHDSKKQYNNFYDYSILLSSYL